MSDAEILQRIAAIVRTGDLSQLTIKSVRAQLEADFGCGATKLLRCLLARFGLRCLSLSRSLACAHRLSRRLHVPASAVSPLARACVLADLTEKKDMIKSETMRLISQPAAPPPTTTSTTTKKKLAVPAPNKTAASEATTAPRSRDGMPSLSRELAAVVGVTHSTHFELVKLIWQYIKQHNLQDAEKKNNVVVRSPVFLFRTTVAHCVWFGCFCAKNNNNCCRTVR